MIKTIGRIANVGKFVNVTGGDNVPFRKLTLIYAENGRGKTTLVDIFRSMQSGEAHYITARRTLGANGSPEVSILLPPGPTTFQNERWNRTLEDLEIFDDTFIHDNVYVGGVVELDHRRNLYRVIVGEKGAKRVCKVDDLDGESRELAREVREAKQRVVDGHCEGIPFDVFINLPRPDGDFDAKLSKLEAKLKAIEQACKIKETEYLKRLLLPALGTDFIGLLAKELPDVSRGAEQAMRSHMQKCGMDHQGEAWLEQGLEYADGGLCPFCEQKLMGNALIENYEAFFGQSYRNLKSEIENLRAEVETDFGEEARLKVQEDIADNRELSTYWRQFGTLDHPELPVDDLRRGWSELRTAAQEHLERKKASPLERMSPEPDLEAALTEWTRLSEKIRSFNEAVDKSHTRLITRLKHDAKDTNPDKAEEVRAELAQLRATQRRHKPEVDEACRKYVLATQSKDELDEAKVAARKELDEHANNVLATCQPRVTKLLKGFGTGYVIRINPKAQYSGGKPSVFYGININRIEVDLGSERTLAGEPCFKNTLSSGDRSALALAFFVARLENDPRLADKVIVFDDPITSQDDIRSAHTQQLICDLYAKTKQLVVLSHDPRFLRGIRGKMAAGDVTGLKICRAGDDSSTLDKWDIDGGK